MRLNCREEVKIQNKHQKKREKKIDLFQIHTQKEVSTPIQSSGARALSHDVWSILHISSGQIFINNINIDTKRKMFEI
jgi:hypothetical protein